MAAEIGLDNSVSGDQGFIDTWLNRAVRDMLRRTRCYVASATSTLTVGQGDYTLASSVLLLETIYVSSNGSDYDLEQCTPSELRSLRRANTSSTSPALRYALLGANLLLLYPVPASADTLYYDYVPVPSEMSSGAHDPSSSTYGGIPVEFHEGLEIFACWKAGSYDDDQSSAQGSRYKQDYLEFIAQMKRDLVYKGGIPAKAQVGRRRNTQLVPSQDMGPWF